MDSQFIWLTVLSVSTPVAGLVGFSLQLRQIKKIRLENEKLQLEIAALKKASEESERRIIKPTTEEVVRYRFQDHAMFRLEDVEEKYFYKSKVSLKEIATWSLIVFICIMGCGRIVYDFIHFISWLTSKL